MAMKADSTEEAEMDGVTKFIRYVFRHYPDIKSYSTLQAYIENLFEEKFDPEMDQIGYMSS